MTYRRGVLVAAILVLLSGPGPVGATTDDALSERFRQAVITIEGEAACHRLTVWLALNQAQRARGLMYVRELADDQGMLFLYPGERRVSMWMKNTLIPLDMVFIRDDGTIANIARETTPLSLESVYAAEPVASVLELNGGAAARFGLGPGRRVFVDQVTAAAP
ncbi:MAG: DUF192 domain-containing protein [Gammaproteobacteria bacterium]|jgi:uncharacterized membrane protein (UPF0127 family)